MVLNVFVLVFFLIVVFLGGVWGRLFVWGFFGFCFVVVVVVCILGIFFFVVFF